MSDRRCLNTHNEITSKNIRNADGEYDFSGLDHRRVSAEQLTACCSSCGMGCNGGWLLPSWGYFAKSGLVTGGLYD